MFTAGAYYLNRQQSNNSSSVRREELVGGSFKGALLNTINDLIVPLGLMAGLSFLSKSDNSQHGGRQRQNSYNDLHQPSDFQDLCQNKMATNMEGGGSIPIIGDTYLGKWLKTIALKYYHLLPASTWINIYIVYGI